MEQRLQFGQIQIVTLCGSRRFHEDFINVAKRLTLKGKAVFSFGDLDNLTREEKTRVEMLQFKKIAASDAVVVINRNNYIGESTERDILFALQCSRPLYFLEKQGAYPTLDTWLGAFGVLV